MKQNNRRLDKAAAQRRTESAINAMTQLNQMGIRPITIIFREDREEPTIHAHAHKRLEFLARQTGLIAMGRGRDEMGRLYTLKGVIAYGCLIKWHEYNGGRP